MILKLDLFMMLVPSKLKVSCVLICMMLVITLFGSSRALATPQRADLIEYQGELYEFGNYGQLTPLDDAFNKNKATKPKEFKSAWTNLNRGHIALWRVHQGKLYLVAVYIADDSEGHVQDNTLDGFVTYPIANIFKSREPVVHAEWFSGKIAASPHKLSRFLSGKKMDGGKNLDLEFKNGVLIEK